MSFTQINFNQHLEYQEDENTTIKCLQEVCKSI